MVPKRQTIAFQPFGGEGLDQFLFLELGGGVGALRLQLFGRAILRYGLLLRAVNASGGKMDHPRAGGDAGGGDLLRRREIIGLDRRGVIDAAGGIRLGGEMHDGVHAFEVRTQVHVPHVEIEEAVAPDRRQIEQRGKPLRAEIVDQHHLGPGFQCR